MMQDIFRKIFKGKVVIVGIGNILRRDDGVGPALIERLKDKTKAVCIDAGSTPENYTGKIVRENPDTILIVDALHLGLAPGEYEILTKDQILKTGFNTHDLSPHMFIEYLEKETQANIFMLGVQPRHVGLGQEMSAEIKKVIEEIAELVKDAQ